MEQQVSGEALWQWRQMAQTQAIAAQVSAYEVDWLLQEVAALDALSLRLGSFRDRPTMPISLPLPQLQALWQQRLEQRVPVQYLLGRTPWRHFSLRVSPAVLIPRPETEEMIDWAIARATPSQARGPWVDLGTGSGAIALGLAEAFPAATIHAVDCSRDALAIARANAQDLGLGDRIQFYEGSWFDPLGALRGQVQGLVSNPPYIPQAELAQLQPEVICHEPLLALDGGPDGLEAMRHLATQSPAYLAPGGLWLVEMMRGQGEAIAQLLVQTGHYTDIQIHTDLAGNERFTSAYRRSA